MRNNIVKKVAFVVLECCLVVILCLYMENYGLGKRTRNEPEAQPPYQKQIVYQMHTDTK